MTRQLPSLPLLRYSRGSMLSLRSLVTAHRLFVAPADRGVLTAWDLICNDAACIAPSSSEMKPHVYIFYNNI